MKGEGSRTRSDYKWFANAYGSEDKRGSNLIIKFWADLREELRKEYEKFKSFKSVIRNQSQDSVNAPDENRTELVWRLKPYGRLIQEVRTGWGKIKGTSSKRAKRSGFRVDYMIIRFLVQIFQSCFRKFFFFCFFFTHERAERKI